MKKGNLQANLARKGADKEKIAARVMRQPELLPEVFEGIGADKGAVKFGCSKILLIISEKKPELLHPEIDYFFRLLESENKILKYGAILAIGNLALVDRKKKIDRILPRYLKPIPGPDLVTAANTIGGAGKIAAAKPTLADKIVKELMKVEKGKYKTKECRNVALGQFIDAVDRFFEHVKRKEPVLKLIRKQLKNPRNSTRKKAEKFLRKRQDSK